LSDIVNSYLTAVDARRQAGDVAMGTFSDYRVAGAAILQIFGRTVDPTGIRPQQLAAFRDLLFPTMRHRELERW